MDHLSMFNAHREPTLRSDPYHNAYHNWHHNQPEIHGGP